MDSTIRASSPIKLRRAQKIGPKNSGSGLSGDDPPLHLGVKHPNIRLAFFLKQMYYILVQRARK
jgi:hypothetical protein